MVSKNNCFFCAVAKCFIISLLNEQYVTTTNSRRWRGNEVVILFFSKMNALK